jgi:hypothetical protein
MLLDGATLEASDAGGAMLGTGMLLVSRAEDAPSCI